MVKDIASWLVLKQEFLFIIQTLMYPHEFIRKFEV